jgi:uncharacterized membrane protein YkoI
MIKKSIIALIVIVAIVGVAFAANNLNIKNSTTKTSSINPENQINASNNNTATSHNKYTQNKISASEAQKIAKTYIKVSGATAGTPKLVNQSGKLVYIVPVIDNGKNVGEIDIDAKTGKNLGGAGGAP